MKVGFLCSALVAAMVAGAPALASENWTEGRIQLSLGGFFEGMGTSVHKSGAVHENDGAVGSDAELRFNGNTTLDNGIEVGFTANWVVQNSCTLTDSAPLPYPSAVCNQDDVNRAFVDFTTGLGKVQFGQQRGASQQLMLTTPSALDRVSADGSELDPLGLANLNTGLDDSVRGAKILYFTPRLFGIQAGLSYLLERSHTGPLITLTPDALHPNQSGTSAFSAAVNFERDIRDFVLRGALAYYTDNRIAGAPDPTGYNLGVQVGYHGFTLGGNFTRGDNMDHRTSYLDQVQTNIWSAGLTWGSGPWLLGLNFANGQDKLTGVSGDFSSVVGGVTYEFNNNIKLGVGYQHDAADPVAGADANGDAVFMETGLKF